tara:strand:+ start:397 stop:561 length:165 start_codon:yes stop_codon:yes gene_type:complete
MKFSKAKKKLAPMDLNIRKERGGWIVFPRGKKDKAETFKTQIEALEFASSRSAG